MGVGRKFTEADEQAALRKWLELASKVEKVHEHLSDPENALVLLGSSIAADDAKMHPYASVTPISHGIYYGVDHLLAIKHLVVDQQVIPLAATFTLSRGAIENLSLALWLMSATKREERLLRCLRWYMVDEVESNFVRDDQGQRRRDTVRTKVRQIARANNLSMSAVKQSPRSTEVVREAQAVAGIADLLFWWRVCSGFAHGKTWASSNINDLEEMGDDYYRMSASASATYLAADTALSLLMVCLRVFDARRLPP